MSEAFIGEVRFFGFSTIPRGWAPCDGQLLAIAQNQALFAILGTTYGGNGVTNFALPNLQGRVPVGAGVSQTTTPVTLGESSGEAAHTLISTEMPAHTHLLMGNETPTANARTPAGNVWSSFTNLYGIAPNTQMAPDALASSGGSQPHANLQPYQVGCYCIALTGIFPSRS
jgi:microcystin-dependent protein